MKHIKVKTFILASFTFMFGAMIYLLFRPTHLLMFKWLDSIGLMGFVNSIRHNLSVIPEWVIYSLPDGLWLFSYCLIMGAIWNFELKRSLLFLVVLPIYAITNEFLQYYHIVSGTFDWMDMIAFLTSFVLGLLYIVLENHNNCLI